MLHALNRRTTGNVNGGLAIGGTVSVTVRAHHPCFVDVVLGEHQLI